MPKKTKSNSLVKFFELLLCVLPLVLFFSYYPVISFGSDSTMNFEISLPILWLLVFDFVGVFLLIKKKLVLNSLKKWRFLLFPLLISLSILWSLNQTRGILTCGVMWLVVIAVLLMVELRSVLSEGFSRKFLKWFFGSSLFVCAWCLVQCILDVCGVARDYSLMCLGCTSYSFGFPHPNGFAIEPQFMGNLLLAPAIISGWLILRSRPRPAGPSPRAAGANARAAALRNATSLKYYAILFFIFSATLFLTFSRGAIYAFAVAMIFMVTWMGVKQKSWKVLWTFAIMAGAFLFTLNLQGILSQVSPTNDTYQSGVAKVLNHLSLGIIDIRQAQQTKKYETISESIVDKTQDEENESAFDGYVAESTEIRKMMTRNAIKVWSRDFRTILFGVGIGGAGQAMYDAGLTGSPKEIVQNEYASLLLEVGLLGVIFAVVLLLKVVYIVTKSPANVAVLTLLVAYGISLLFFAGLPNALHIYLLPVSMCLFLDDKHLKEN